MKKKKQGKQGGKKEGRCERHPARARLSTGDGLATAARACEEENAISLRVWFGKRVIREKKGRKNE